MSSTTPGSEPGGTGDAERPVDDDTAHDVEPVSDPGAPTQTPASVDSGDGPDATARLDAAVERANAEAAASASSDSDAKNTDATEAEAYSEPVAADAVRRETYVPSATMAPGAGAGAATLAEEPAVAPQPAAPQTIYVQAPTPPRRQGNRGFGAFVALVGTVVFALVYAGVAYLLLAFFGAGRPDGLQVFTEFLARPVFWVPVAAFFIGFALLAAIVNRGAWWNYAVFGLLVGVFVYFAYLGGSLLTVEAWTLTADEAGQFMAQRWLDPFAIAAFIIAREIPIWLGGWLAARGRTVTERNRVAREAYDRELAAGPQAQRP